jgi:hypothetical protein
MGQLDDWIDSIPPAGQQQQQAAPTAGGTLDDWIDSIPAATRGGEAPQQQQPQPQPLPDISLAIGAARGLGNSGPTPSQLATLRTIHSNMLAEPDAHTAPPMTHSLGQEVANVGATIGGGFQRLAGGLVSQFAGNQEEEPGSLDFGENEPGEAQTPDTRTPFAQQLGSDLRQNANAYMASHPVQSPLGQVAAAAPMMGAQIALGVAGGTIAPALWAMTGGAEMYNRAMDAVDAMVRRGEVTPAQGHELAMKEAAWGGFASAVTAMLPGFGKITPGFIQGMFRSGLAMGGQSVANDLIARGYHGDPKETGQIIDDALLSATIGGVLHGLFHIFDTAPGDPRAAAAAVVPEPVVDIAAKRWAAYRSGQMTREEALRPENMSAGDVRQIFNFFRRQEASTPAQVPNEAPQPAPQASPDAAGATEAPQPGPLPVQPENAPESHPQGIVGAPPGATAVDNLDTGATPLNAIRGLVNPLAKGPSNAVPPPRYVREVAANGQPPAGGAVPAPAAATAEQPPAGPAQAPGQPPQEGQGQGEQVAARNVNPEATAVAQGAVTLANVPAYVREEIERRVAVADRLGVSDPIEELSAQRLTAGEIYQRLADKFGGRPPGEGREIIRAVRAMRGIPAADSGAEFEEWLRSRGAPNALPEPSARNVGGLLALQEPNTIGGYEARQPNELQAGARLDTGGQGEADRHAAEEVRQRGVEAADAWLQAVARNDPQAIRDATATMFGQPARGEEQPGQIVLDGGHGGRPEVRASGDYGEEAGSQAAAVGARPPPERGRAGQPPGESGTAVGVGAREAARPGGLQEGQAINPGVDSSAAGQVGALVRSLPEMSDQKQAALRARLLSRLLREAAPRSAQSDAIVQAVKEAAHALAQRETTSMGTHGGGAQSTRGARPSGGMGQRQQGTQPAGPVEQQPVQQVGGGGGTQAPKPVAKKPPKPFSKADLERVLIQHHEQSRPDYTTDDETALANASSSGSAWTFFGKKFPGEVEQYLEGNPAAKKLFALTNDATKAGGEDAMSNMGDRYFQIADKLSARPKKKLMEEALATAEGSQDPQMQLAAAVYQNLPSKLPKHDVKDPKQLPTWSEFDSFGHHMRIEEDADGYRVLKDGEDFPVLPVDGLDAIPVDKGTLKQSEPEVPEGDVFPASESSRVEAAPRAADDRLDALLDAQYRKPREVMPTTIQQSMVNMFARGTPGSTYETWARFNPEAAQRLGADGPLAWERAKARSLEQAANTPHWKTGDSIGSPSGSLMATGAALPHPQQSPAPTGQRRAGQTHADLGRGGSSGFRKPPAKPPAPPAAPGQPPSGPAPTPAHLKSALYGPGSFVADVLAPKAKGIVGGLAEFVDRSARAWRRRRAARTRAQGGTCAARDDGPPRRRRQPDP